MSKLLVLTSIPSNPHDQFAYFAPTTSKNKRFKNYTKIFILYKEEEEYLIINITFNYSLNNNASLKFLKC
jgi:hypothetical protein